MKVTPLSPRSQSIPHIIQCSDLVLCCLGDYPRAVAVGYKQGVTSTPLVTAMRSGYEALKLVEMAIELEKVLCEDWRITEVLMGRTIVGGEIPTSLYKRIARILAFVIAVRAHGAHEPIVLKGTNGIWRGPTTADYLAVLVDS